MQKYKFFHQQSGSFSMKNKLFISKKIPAGNDGHKCKKILICYAINNSKKKPVKDLKYFCFYGRHFWFYVKKQSILPGSSTFPKQMVKPLVKLFV
jgi:hypothetical protein